MFSQKSFIEASKKFVCVRLGTYENILHQDMIRSLLGGRLENTAFVVFAPDGRTKLTRAGRKPQHAFGENVIEGMDKIIQNYPATNLDKPATLSDFNSFQQSLNASSADQRLLVFAVTPNKSRATTIATLRTVFNDPTTSGRFFYDIAGSADINWANNIKGVSQKTGIFIIQSGKYGQTGTALAQLPLDTSAMDLKQALLTANTKFSETEKRKVYNQHVTDGRKEGITYRSNLITGEDRNGDGIIDTKPQKAKSRPRIIEPEGPSNNPERSGLNGFPIR